MGQNNITTTTQSLRIKAANYFAVISDNFVKNG